MVPAGVAHEQVLGKPVLVSVLVKRAARVACCVSATWRVAGWVVDNGIHSVCRIHRAWNTLTRCFVACCWLAKVAMRATVCRVTQAIEAAVAFLLRL